jgi:hypothetical protein
MEGGVKGFSCLKNSISTRGTISTGTTETPWIDYKNASLAVADSAVGMSIYHAVNLGKKIPELKFDTFSKVGTMGQAYHITPEGKRCFSG